MAANAANQAVSHQPAKPGTMFSSTAPPSTYGYEPTRQLNKKQVKQKVIRGNTRRENDDARNRFGVTLPEWWPLHPDGSHMTHLWVASEQVSDIFSPKCAMSQLDCGDFSKREMKFAALLHISGAIRFGDKDRRQEPILPTTADFQCLLDSSSRTNHYIDQCRAMRQPIWFARLDLIAMWQNGELTGQSFADLSTTTRIDDFFRALPASAVVTYETFEREYGWCRRTSARSKEILIVTRGDSLVKYATLVDEEDRLLANQVGGFNGNTKYGVAVAHFWATQQPEPSNAAIISLAQFLLPLGISKQAFSSSAAPQSAIRQQASSSSAPSPAPTMYYQGPPSNDALALVCKELCTAAKALRLREEPVEEPVEAMSHQVV